MFRVVEFSDGVQAVPMNWIDGDFCRYPPYINQFKINKAVANSEAPEDNWTSHKILRFFGHPIDDYETAIRKTKLAQKYSDVDSDGPLADKKKRKVRAAKQLFSEDDDDDDDEDVCVTKKKQLKPLPKLPQPPNQSHAISTKKKQLLVNEPFEEDIFYVSGPSSIPEGMEWSPAGLRRSPRKHTSLGTNTRPSQSFKQSYANQQHLSPRTESDFQSEVLNKLTNLTNSLDLFQTEILRKLNVLQYRMKNIETKVDELADTSKKDEGLDVGEVEEINLFPLKTKQEVEKFEKNCKEDPQFYKKCIMSLKGLGGGSLLNTTLQVLRKTFSNNLAESYSLLGRKKDCFKSLLLYKLILQIVRSKYPDLTEKEFDSIVARWLVQAKLRRVRAEKNPVNQAEEANEDNAEDVLH